MLDCEPYLQEEIHEMGPYLINQKLSCSLRPQNLALPSGVLRLTASLGCSFTMGIPLGGPHREAGKNVVASMLRVHCVITYPVLYTPNLRGLASRAATSVSE